MRICVSFLVALSCVVSAQAAENENHWAFEAIGAETPPEVGSSAWGRNAIDAFVLDRLEGEGFAPSPEADRHTLVRRLYLDLTGLPPTPAQVDDFIYDVSPYAYARLVNRLLASPHYGERWGRYWLDLARYADSDGFEKDTVRPHAWRYREWVINALNRDLPYDQFLIEQLAGDLLPNATLEQKVATGFHRNTLTNKEGGVDVEQYRVEQVVDRVNTTASVFMGLTMACAQCHDHKYDPFTQKEYFGLYAFFNSGVEKDVLAPLDSEVVLFRREQSRFERQRAELQRKIDKYKPRLENKLSKWEEVFREELADLEWTVLSPSGMVSSGGASFETLDDNSILVGGNAATVDTYTVVVPTHLNDITAFRLEVLTDESLPRTGPGRAEHGNFILSEFTVTASQLDNPGTATPVEFASAWADHAERGFAIEKAFDGDTTTGWSADAWRDRNENRIAVFELKEGLNYLNGVTLSFTFDHQYGRAHAMGRFRLYAATGSKEHLRLSPEFVASIRKNADERSEAEKNDILAYFGTQDPEMRVLLASLQGHLRAKPKLESTYAQTLVENENPPQTHIHLRGSFMDEGEAVFAHTPAILPPLKEADSPNRLDLARWLVNPEHPLTSRVAANRVWEHLFGRGLVETSEDFGVRGAAPTHPELLDWLAEEYMRLGWSTKGFIKLIVSSDTYRQSSRYTPELLERDVNNDLLARQNRYRVEAEGIRDLFLAASGLMSYTVGGPSVRPALPKGIAELGYNNSVKWAESEGAAKYRRGLYIHFQRTVPYPMLMTFDCPDSNVTAIRRMRSNTPLQSLTLMNDPNFFEASQAMARRAVACDETMTDELQHVFRICLARTPNEAELAALEALWQDQYESFVEDIDLAKEVTGAYLSDDADPAVAASWVMVARAIMNLDEFITRE